MDTANLIAYLPFDTSTTEDKLGNTWTAYGSPTIEDGALQLNGASYLQSDSIAAQIGSDSWTVHWQAICNQSGERTFFGTYNANVSTSSLRNNCWVRCIFYNGNVAVDLYGNSTASGLSLQYGTSHHYALSYDGTNLRLFVDGVLKITKAASVTLGGAFRIGLCAGRQYASDCFTGSIANFMILKGVAWTENFTPPTAEEYMQLNFDMSGESYFSFEADVEREIANEPWKPAMNLKVWLPFDESPTKDLCGNTWTATAAPTITCENPARGNELKVTQAHGLDSALLAMSGGITLGGANFTIRGHFNLTQTSNINPGCELFTLYKDDGIYLRRTYSGTAVWLYCFGSSTANVAIELGGQYFYEVDYDHAAGTLKLFLNGELKATLNKTIQRTNFTRCTIGYSYWSADSPIGTFDEFQIYDGAALHSENFTPPTAEDYVQEELDLTGGEAFVAFAANVEREIINNRKTVDRHVAFTGQSGCYGELPLEVLPGATTFTIEVKLTTTSTKSSSDYWLNGHILGREIGGNWHNDFGLYVKGGKLCFWDEPSSGGSRDTYNTASDAVINDGDIHKVAVVSSNGAIDLYCDGELVAHTDNVNAKITDTAKILLAQNSNGGSYLQMDLYEARFWSIARTQEEIFAEIDGTEAGLEAWYIPSYYTNIIPDLSGNERHATLYGSPEVVFAYELPFDIAADMERKVINAPLDFEYEDGTDVATGLTVLEGLDATQSRTGTAFYQTRQAKCFDLPPLPEVWIEFDVYFNGTQRWRAYNGGSNGTTGITAQTDGRLSFFANGTNVGNFDSVCKTNELQTIKLHMIAGATGGIIEAWVDGNFIYRYVGDVNHGEPFNDLFLQSDGAGTFFSSLTLSNTEFPTRRWRKLDFNMERRVANALFSWDDTAVTEEEFMRIIWSPPGGDYPPNFILVKERIRTKTGDAFYQTEIVKTFDLQATYEIWIDFDVYFGGTDIWRAGNAGANGICGITSAVDGSLIYMSNGAVVQTVADICKAGEIQPVLLHMISGVNDGVIEAWVNGQFVYRYVGDVNNGEDFNDIFMQCDGDGTVFSNLLFSTERLDPRSYILCIELCILRNGAVLYYPFRYYETPIKPAVAIRYGGKNWYNRLREPADPAAGKITLWHDATEYALSTVAT